MNATTKLKKDRAELLHALETLMEVFPLGKFNIREDFEVFARHAAAQRAVHAAKQKLRK